MTGQQTNLLDRISQVAEKIKDMPDWKKGTARNEWAGVVIFSVLTDENSQQISDCKAATDLKLGEYRSAD